jgi:biopolymer transport protein ExbB/TolQ
MEPIAHGVSAVGLVLQADPVVKAVMGLLALASLACWTVILDKATRIARLKRELRRLEAALRSGAPLHEPQPGIAGAVLAAGIEAWHDADETETRAERRERIERAMRARMAAALRRLEAGLPVLATTGSTAPFVGLFGTVWGIMNSFSSIAQSQDTSLAIVAPGIAEALFATALGLVAAIPAVVAYNKLVTDLGRAGQRFGAAIGEIGNRLARARPGSLRAAAE